MIGNRHDSNFQHNHLIWRYFSPNLAFIACVSCRQTQTHRRTHRGHTVKPFIAGAKPNGVPPFRIRTNQARPTTSSHFPSIISQFNMQWTNAVREPYFSHFSSGLRHRILYTYTCTRFAWARTFLLRQPLANFHDRSHVTKIGGY